jgi:hypothetical protein
LVEGKPQTVAYQEAFNCKTYESAGASATRLLKDARVISLVSQLRKARDEAAVLTIQEKREYLAELLRTPINEVKPDSKLVQDVTVTTTTNKDGQKSQRTTFKLPSKLDAIKIDNAMMGHNAPKEIDVNLGISEIYQKILEQEDDIGIVHNVTPQKSATANLPGPLEGMQ